MGSSSGAGGSRWKPGSPAHRGHAAWCITAMQTPVRSSPWAMQPLLQRAPSPPRRMQRAHGRLLLSCSAPLHSPEIRLLLKVPSAKDGPWEHNCDPLTGSGLSRHQQRQKPENGPRQREGPRGEAGPSCPCLTHSPPLHEVPRGKLATHAGSGLLRTAPGHQPRPSSRSQSGAGSGLSGGRQPREVLPIPGQLKANLAGSVARGRLNDASAPQTLLVPFASIMQTTALPDLHTFPAPHRSRCTGAGAMLHC